MKRQAKIPMSEQLRKTLDEVGGEPLDRLRGRHPFA
jgi:hypothetical protein